jgi:hypothetical protein
MRNKKGELALTLLALTVVAFVGVSTAATYALGGQELAKKNSSSIWAHMQGLCTGDSPDSRCIMK